VKGGDFKHELEEEAGIQNYTLHAISNMVPSLLTDKQLLFIPTAEIISFYHRKESITVPTVKKEVNISRNNSNKRSIKK